MFGRCLQQQFMIDHDADGGCRHDLAGLQHALVGCGVLALRHHLPGMRWRAVGAGSHIDLARWHQPAHVAHISGAVEKFDMAGEIVDFFRQNLALGQDGGAIFLGQRHLDPVGEVLVLVGEARCTELAEFLVHGAGQHSVRDEFGRCGIEDRLHRGAGHEGGALGNLLHALGDLANLFEFGGADLVENLGFGLHYVRGVPAGIGNGIMQTRLGNDMLAQEVDADIHQFDRVERTAAAIGIEGGMRRAALEIEIDLVGGQHSGMIGEVFVPWMPGEGDIDTLEKTRARHEGLAAAAFLGRAAEIFDGAGQVQPVLALLECQRSRQGAGAKKIVTAAMPTAAGDERIMRQLAGVLAEIGQGIVFTENGDNRRALSIAGDEGGLDAACLALHLKSGLFQCVGQKRAGALFLVADFRKAPDLVADRCQQFFLFADDFFDDVEIGHE